METPDNIKKGLKACVAGDCGSKRHGCPYNKSYGCIEALSKDAFAYINLLENQLREARKMVTPAVPAPTWISVEDRIPEIEKSVLVYVKTCNYEGATRGYIAKAFYRDCRYYTDDSAFEQNYVTHWMPLPEPPKEERV